MSILTWLCILPAAASFFQRTHGNDVESGLIFAKLAARHSLFLAALCVFVIMILWYSWLWLVVVLAVPAVILIPPVLYPLSAAALPALYSLAASHFTFLARGDELSALFGSLAAWVSLCEYLSYYITGDGVWSFSYGVALALPCLAISFVFLVQQNHPGDSSDGIIASRSSEL
ncbi:hypothetical protein K438DRAFT_1820550 [Mycena galopus ATCC 62051]|nr:hypothetical protein K438DRAFT_1820550 [Mycena galopus ATCC 62051]